ncbi:MAG: carboxypeptidase regulatory-like domain-containing protein [bacterium]
MQTPRRLPQTIAIPLLVLPTLFLLAAAPGLAASICGTVTDAVTAQPVAQAGVFLRTQAGAYTGDHAATDAAGGFCIDGLVAGTYILEVLVDDYVVAYRTGVEVADDVSNVPLAADLPAARLALPWPNPSNGGVQLRISVTRDTPVTLGVYDLRGRLVRSWSDPAVAPGDHDYLWDGLGADGRPAPSGLYLVRITTPADTHSRPLVLAR